MPEALLLGVDAPPRSDLGTQREKKEDTKEEKIDNLLIYNA